MKEADELEFLKEDELGDRRLVKTLGMVQGRALWKKPVLHDYLTGIRLLLGSAPNEDEALKEARKTAKLNLVTEASKLGANALLDHHYMFVRLGLMTVEVRCFGRAVIIS